MSFLTLFLLSGFVLAFLFCLEHLFPTNLDLKVFHVAHLPRDPSLLLEVTIIDRFSFHTDPPFASKAQTGPKKGREEIKGRKQGGKARRKTWGVLVPNQGLFGHAFLL